MPIQRDTGPTKEKYTSRLVDICSVECIAAVCSSMAYSGTSRQNRLGNITFVITLSNVPYIIMSLCIWSVVYRMKLPCTKKSIKSLKNGGDEHKPIICLTDKWWIHGGAHQVQ